MSESNTTEAFKLDCPPIMETVVDIDCDLPHARPLSKIETEATASLRESYPKAEKIFFKQVQFDMQAEDKTPFPHQIKEGSEALLFRSEDGRQLTQFRTAGYSFNRLAPYEGLDTYLPEIRRTWENYVAIAHPVSVRKIGLRTINRIHLPLDQHGRLNLGDYLKTDPRLPQVEGRKLSFTGFMHQHQLRDEASGQEAILILASQGQKEGRLNLLLDIHAFDRNTTKLNTNNWAGINSVIQSLRGLKNGLFANTLTEKCLNQF